MDHVSSWLQAALVPDTWDVAGIDCSPVSVWHSFILEQSGNAYVSAGLLDKDAAAELLVYCSRDYAGGKALFVKPLARRRALMRVSKAIAKKPWADVDAAVRDYVGTCLRVPQHKSAPTPTKGDVTQYRSVAAPLAFVLVQFLAQGNPAMIEAAWNTPFCMARCMFDAHRDITGQTETLESIDEERRFDEWQERQKNGGAT